MYTSFYGTQCGFQIMELGECSGKHVADMGVLFADMLVSLWRP